MDELEEDVNCAHSPSRNAEGFQKCCLPGADRHLCPFTALGAPQCCDSYKPREEAEQ